MGKKAENTFIGFAILAGGCFWLFQNYPEIALLLIFILVIWFISNSRSSLCDLCDMELKRTVYTWNIHGKKKRICPNCNRQLERKKSKDAISKL